ncbi:glutamyl-tRNA reductase, partial [Mycobacterium tuberculosis]|nr:glutamyl-tRNA reductase [Mycobacterium tuberculosis]
MKLRRPSLASIATVVASVAVFAAGGHVVAAEVASSLLGLRTGEVRPAVTPLRPPAADVVEAVSLGVDER